jgi:hypothetical protein
MRNVKSVGACFLAACAVSAIAVSSASAALPELGRCVAVEKVVEGKKSSYHGAYMNKICTKPSAMKKGKYEWVEGPGAADTFTAEVEEPLFETVGGEQVECERGFLEGGEYTGAKTEKFSSVQLVGCLTAIDTLCQTNPHEAGKIEDPKSVEGELGTISGEKGTAGWALKSLLFAFTCGEFPEVEDIQTLEGSVIGAVRHGSASDLNRMGAETEIVYKQKEGTQSPEAFEGGEKETLTTTRITGVSKAVETTGLGADQLNKNGEPLEIRAKG